MTPISKRIFKYCSPPLPLFQRLFLVNIIWFYVPYTVLSPLYRLYLFFYQQGGEKSLFGNGREIAIKGMQTRT